MKRFILSIFLLVVLVCTGNAKRNSKHVVKDGLYLIVSIDSTASQRALPPNGLAVKFSKLFEEFNQDALTRIVVDANEYVPLDLGKSPTAEQQTKDKKKLLLTLTPEAAAKLKTFTAKYLMRMVAIVVDGEVLTIHKVKAALTSGELQITRCTDNACERLYYKLEGNVKR